MVVSLLSIMPGIMSGDTSTVRTLRVLRALRPLRVIARNKSLKLVVNALVRALKPIFNVVLVCSLFLLIFAIVMTSLFKGSTYTCTGSVAELFKAPQLALLQHPVPFAQLTPTQQAWGLGCTMADRSLNCTPGAGYGAGFLDDAAPTSKAVCAWLGGAWTRAIPQSFDNVLDSLFSLFQVCVARVCVTLHA
ncbi:MAG: ion transporter [Methanosarcinales archaeon]|nr:MAG: ion transporter [Methanosarcinales archaeon]